MGEQNQNLPFEYLFPIRGFNVHIYVFEERTKQQPHNYYVTSPKKGNEVQREENIKVLK